jgi:voltage-gated potassium channel
LLLVVVSSIAILQFEALPNANIKTAEDALWWAISTLTAGGSADRFPITSAGRIVATLLMIAGVALLGVLSGFVASWFLKPAEAARESDLAELAAEVRALRARLEL